MEPDEKACPYCAETIKTAALKCKHCGEFLSERPPQARQATSSGESRAEYLARINSTNTGYTGKSGGRKKLSSVGNNSGGSLSCPKCGGTNFTAKRSKKGKVIGITALGVGGLIAPKSQVKCVACGTMFKRG